MNITYRGSSSVARSALAQAGVVLASTGRPFSAAAIERAAGLANGSRIRVVTVARIHGFAFGLQHPGLMPNKREKDAAQAVVTDAIKALHKRGLTADGEVVITRTPGKAFARSAKSAKTVTHVVIDPGAGRLARLEATATARSVRLRTKGITVQTAP